ncbi:UbiA family prenyltransferase [Paraglaciecola aquimarina]|uniref:UbiA family prenyltransferase n=1 Tax=Paraglaciecola aquimarina TaxID=1235557 RepID=A0ABU3SZ33_9ALTE|nr:UbiA family prenyltransferase [Paraglaciecola aquimarina]MDU0355275.1 UbiA family prenyltransferase [Paraglaciecola aquimarina]
MATFVTYLKLIRAPAGLTALSNIIAASVIMSLGQLNVDILYLLTASMCFYFAGMTLNDCFDYAEDLAERPSRPIPSGNVSINQAWALGAGLMGVGLCLAFSYSALSGYIGIALSGAILIYNGWLKEGLIGSFCMAACRYLNWLLGASYVAISLQSYLIAVPIFAYITGLTYLSKQETNAQNKNAIWLCAVALMVSFLSCLYLIEYEFTLQGIDKWLALGLLVIWILLMFNKLKQVFQDFCPANIQQMIIFMVIGVIPLDALLVALSGQYIFALIILALLPPCRILNKRLNAIT